MNRHGEYIQAPPIPDTVLINIGDLMQRWTSDKLLASVSSHILNKLARKVSSFKKCKCFALSGQVIRKK